MARAALWLATLLLVAASLTPPAMCQADEPTEQPADDDAPDTDEAEGSMSIPLDEFTSVRSCLPFNLLVAPSGDDETYAITIGGETSLADVIVAEVVEGVLAVGTSAGFNTSGVINVTVTMPSGALENVDKNSATDLVVAPGFEVPSLTLMSSDVGRYLVFGVTTDELTIENAGTATVYVEGTIGEVRVSSSGTGNVFLKGVTDSVDVDGSDIAKIIIDPATDDVEISGAVSQLAQVFTTGGDCDIQGGRFLFPACSTTRKSKLPEFDPEFSCGLIVDGNISCTPSSVFESMVLATAPSTTSTFSFASGPGASASAMARGGPDGSTVTSRSIGDFGALVSSANGDGAAAVAVAAQACNTTDEDALKMLSKSR